MQSYCGWSTRENKVAQNCYRRWSSLGYSDGRVHGNGNGTLTSQHRLLEQMSTMEMMVVVVGTMENELV